VGLPEARRSRREYPDERRPDFDGRRPFQHPVRAARADRGAEGGNPDRVHGAGSGAAATGTTVRTATAAGATAVRGVNRSRTAA
jgi:hypothetical protein